MFGFVRKTSLEKVETELKDLERENEFLKRSFELEKAEAIAELRREMSESLIKSDLLRNEAVAKLAIYEKMDTKADANTIKEMVGKLIEALGKQGVNVIK